MLSNSEISGHFAGSIAEIELIHAHDINAPFQREWETLARNVQRANPFFEHWFLKSALAYFNHADEVSLLVARNSVTRQLVGLVPVVKKYDYRKFPIPYFQTWVHPFCFNGVPLILRDWITAFYEATAVWIDTHPQNTKFLQLLVHPFSSPLRSAVIDSVGTSRVFIQDIFERPYFEKAPVTGSNFSDYFDNIISAKHRSNLRRTWRRLNEQGAVTSGDLEITPALIEDYLLLEKRGWKNPSNHGITREQSTSNDQFLRSLLLNGAQRGNITCRGIKIDGRPIAMAFQLISNGHVAGFKTVYDEAFAIYSPGVHVLIDVIKSVIENPHLQSFDSCSQAGQSLLTRLMPDRMPIAQLNLTQSGRLDRALMSTLSLVN